MSAPVSRPIQARPDPARRRSRISGERLVKTGGRTFSLLLAMVMLGSCYFPIRFDAEIEISRTGHYSFIFDGFLADVELFDGLRTGEVGAEEEKEQVEKLLSDLKRDQSASNVAYVRKGRFRLTWQRSGDLLKARSVVFLRRNEHIFGISYNKDTGRISLLGRSLSTGQKESLIKRGLVTLGQLRVITDAKVVSHNATAVKDFKRRPGNKVYIWEINSIEQPTPSLVISLR